MTTDTLDVRTPNALSGIARAISGQRDNLPDQYTPAFRSPHINDVAQDRTLLEQMLQKIRSAGRTRLNPSEIEQLLTTYGISALVFQSASGLARRSEESLGTVEVSRTTTQQAMSMYEGYKLIISSHVDQQCGPVLSLRAYWKNPPAGAHIAAYDDAADLDCHNPRNFSCQDDPWATWIDPEGGTFPRR